MIVRPIELITPVTTRVTIIFKTFFKIIKLLPKEPVKNYTLFSFQEREQKIQQYMRHYIHSDYDFQYSVATILSLTIHGYIKIAQRTSPIIC